MPKGMDSFFILRRKMGKVLLEEEKALFYDELKKLTKSFYQYMHGDRTQPDGAVTLFKKFVSFYDADWIGLLDVDCSFESWSAKCFYNAVTGSTTETLIGKPERFASAPSWEKAVRKGEPIVVEDVEQIKDCSPIEYAMYKRLEVDSVIGVPYRNFHKGLMVVKNPKRFKTETYALNIMSYIVTNEIIEVNRRKNITRQIRPGEPLNYRDVRIKLLGDFCIESKDILITADDLKSDLTKFAIAYMTVNLGRKIPQSKLSAVYFNGEDTARWTDIMYKFRLKWREARPLVDCEKYILIETHKAGYCFSENLDIKSDVICFEQMVKTIEDAGNIETKIELLEDFYVRYGGDFLPGETDCEWILTTRADYKRRYLEKMSQMLQLKFDKAEYNSVVHYSTDLLKLYPHSVEIRYWQVLAFAELKKSDCMNNTIDAAKKILQKHELKLFIDMLGMEHEKDATVNFIKECVDVEK